MTTMEATQSLLKDVKSRVKVECRLITPTWAAAKLTMNDTEECPNRSINSGRLANMARDLNEGRWNHEGWDCVAFDEDGHLINGQHRLRMVVMTGKPIVGFVMTGVRTVVKEVADTAFARNFGAVLKMRNVPNYVHAATLTKVMASHKNGQLGWNGGGTAAAGYFSNSYMAKVFEDYPLIEEGAAWYAQNQNSLKTLGCGVTVPGVRLIANIKHDGTATQTKVHEFFDAVAMGTMVCPKHPALALRTRLIDNRLSRERLPRHTLYAAIIHAWNMYKKGREISSLRIPANFPEVL